VEIGTKYTGQGGLEHIIPSTVAEPLINEPLIIDGKSQVVQVILYSIFKNFYIY
tara:strand:- start:4534 stop:4695 length:162 start_codon:yes stop_codon:yes gene_type:complete